MELSPVDKRVIEAIAKGLSEGGSIKVDSLNWPNLAKMFLNGCIKSAENTVDSWCSNRDILKKISEQEDTAQTIKRPLEIESPTQVDPEMGKYEAELVEPPIGEF